MPIGGPPPPPPPKLGPPPPPPPFLPSITGVLRSLVCTFLRPLPAWICLSNSAEAMALLRARWVSRGKWSLVLIDDCGQGRDYRDHCRSPPRDTVLWNVAPTTVMMVVMGQSLDLPHQFYSQTSEDGGSVLGVRAYYAREHESKRIR